MTHTQSSQMLREACEALQHVQHNHCYLCAWMRLVRKYKTAQSHRERFQRAFYRMDRELSL